MVMMNFLLLIFARMLSWVCMGYASGSMILLSPRTSMIMRSFRVPLGNVCQAMNMGNMKGISCRVREILLAE